MEYLLLIFTLGYLIQDFASIVLILRIKQKKSIEGLSLETQIMYFIGTVMRLIYVFDTRLSSEFHIWIELALSTSLFSYIFYLFKKYKHTVFSEKQSKFVNWKVLLAICVVLSFFMHPGIYITPNLHFIGAKNEYYVTVQQLVSCSMFLEAVALLPQIKIISESGSVEHKVGRFLVLLAVSRVCRLLFWVIMYLQGDKFIYLIAADVVHTILIGDFVYIYFQTKQGEPILLR